MSTLYSFDFYFISLDDSQNTRILELINSDRAKIIGKVIVIVQDSILFICLVFCYFSMIKDLIKYIRKKGKKKQKVQDHQVINIFEIKPRQDQGIEECKIQFPQDPKNFKHRKNFSSDESFQGQGNSSRILLKKDKKQKCQPAENQNTTQVEIMYNENQNQTRSSNKIQLMSQLKDQEQKLIFVQKKIKLSHRWLRQIAKRLFKRAIIKGLIKGLSFKYQMNMKKKKTAKLNPSDSKDKRSKKRSRRLDR